MIRRKGFHTHVYKQMLMNWIYFLVVFTYVDKIVCMNEENESELASWWATESKMYTECVSKMNCIASHFVYIQNLSTLPHNVQTSMCFYINDVTDNNHWSLSYVVCCTQTEADYIHTTDMIIERTYVYAKNYYAEPIQRYELGAVDTVYITVNDLFRSTFNQFHSSLLFTPTDSKLHSGFYVQEFDQFWRFENSPSLVNMKVLAHHY